MYGGRLTPHPPAQSATCGRSNLKGLLYVVCFGKLVFGDGLTGGDAWNPQQGIPVRGYKISFPTISCSLVTIFLAQAFT